MLVRQNSQKKTHYFYAAILHPLGANVFISGKVLVLKKNIITNSHKVNCHVFTRLQDIILRGKQIH